MAERASKRRPEGITIRHARGCGAQEGGRCRCRPAYQAQVFSPRDRRTIRKSFKSLADARAWRSDTKAGAESLEPRAERPEPRARERKLAEHRVRRLFHERRATSQLGLRPGIDLGL